MFPHKDTIVLYINHSVWLLLTTSRLGARIKSSKACLLSSIFPLIHKLNGIFKSGFLSVIENVTVFFFSTGISYWPHWISCSLDKARSDSRGHCLFACLCELRVCQWVHTDSNSLQVFMDFGQVYLGWHAGYISVRVSYLSVIFSEWQLTILLSSISLPFVKP